MCKIDSKKERERKRGYLVTISGGLVQRVDKPAGEPVAVVRHALLRQILDAGHELGPKDRERRLPRHFEDNALDHDHRIPSTGSEKVSRYRGLLLLYSLVDFVHFSPFFFFWKKENSFPTGNQLPDVRDLTTEIPLTLQNSHYSVADSVPYLANVVNVACLHCRPATQLSTDLETFLQRGESLFRKSN